MTKQKELILKSLEYVKKNLPGSFKPKVSIISDKKIKTSSNFKVLKEIDLKKIPPCFESFKGIDSGKMIFAKHKNIDLILIEGRIHFYDGFSMRELGHYVYMLKFLGIKKLIGIEEVGYLNPRFKCGELALIYDQINFMGDNPLIGENDYELGIRFPDMSNAYDIDSFQKVYKIFQDEKMKVNESVYLGIIGPESETEAEARFYREIGSDLLGYSLAPENITAVHCDLKFIGIGVITRELIADKMMEDERTEKQKSNDRKKYLAEGMSKLNKIIRPIIEKI
jgi:purine-nucleoside phosphorylase